MLECLGWLTVQYQRLGLLYHQIHDLIIPVLALGLDDLGLIVIHALLGLVALEEDLPQVLQTVLLTHQFLVSVIRQPIIALEQLWISLAEHVEYGAVLENEVIEAISVFLAHDFEDVESVEQYLVLFVPRNIH